MKNMKIRDRLLLLVISFSISFTFIDFRKEKSLEAAVTPVQSIFYTTPFLLLFSSVLISSIFVSHKNNSDLDQIEALKKLDVKPLTPLALGSQALMTMPSPASKEQLLR
jgi:hypothetical protein